jgi:molybdate transport repressor ModE-like protein
MTAIVQNGDKTTLAALWDATRMRLLVELASQSSISAAARAVGITQSTASEHVRVLEIATRQPLVERFGRGSRLTQAGHVLAMRASEALAALSAGEAEIDELAGLRSGRIVLAASSAPGGYLLPDALGCFREEHPDVSVELDIASSAEVVDGVLAGHVQLAIVGAAPADDRLVAEPFADDEIIGVAKPGILPVEGGCVSPAALSQETLLTRELGSSTQALADAELAAAGVKPASSWQLGSSDAVKRAAQAGLGYALVSRYTIAEEVGDGRLEAFRIAGRPPLERQFVVVSLAGRRRTPAESGFLATLTSCCAKTSTVASGAVGPPPSL